MNYCPFCGSHGDCLTPIDVPGYPGHWCVVCSKCGARGPIVPSSIKEEGIRFAENAWNTNRVLYHRMESWREDMEIANKVCSVAFRFSVLLRDRIKGYPADLALGYEDLEEALYPVRVRGGKLGGGLL